MLYLFGTFIKKKKNIRVALTSIYGIAYKTSCKICNSIGIGNKKKINKITNTQIYNIRQIIKKNYKIAGDLRKDILMQIKRYIDIKAYRGLRHKLAYPVRGQRTHTNAQTQKLLSKERFLYINNDEKTTKKGNK
jgi:small subunit ribosomal protein S13